MIKVVLIDDHDLVRSGLRQMLETDSGIEVVGEAGTGAEGIQLVRTLKPLKPDVVVLDVNLPDITGLEVAHRLLSHQEDIKILIVSGITNDLLPFKLLDAGALSYLTKNASGKNHPRLKNHLRRSTICYSGSCQSSCFFQTKC